MTAAEILKLIEEVDPSDTAKLDEIDAQVWCFLNNEQLESVERSSALPGELCINFYHPNPGHGNGFRTSREFYTRSRDALKAIRPEGYVHDCWSDGVIFCSNLKKRGQKDDGTIRPALPTEELAELHAILESIEFERSQEAA